MKHNNNCKASPATLDLLREATRGKKQLNFGFLLKGGGVKPESKPFEELLKEPFFSLSLDICQGKGGGLMQIQTF